MYIKHLCTLLTLQLVTSLCYAQTDCDNIGFENGDFSGWRLEYGTVSNSASSTTVVYSTPVQGTLFSGHKIMTLANGNDPKITVEAIPVVPPGSNYAARIGNTLIGAIYDRISKRITVTTANTLLIYKFAIVLQNPVLNHTQYQQPKFILKITDQSGNSNDCNIYEVFASRANTNFKTQGTGDDLLVYRNWTTAALDLSNYVGQTITLSVTATDCTEGGHFGYAYFDAECLKAKIVSSSACLSSNGMTLTAPTGFETYVWNTGQTTEAITIPNPVPGTRYTVRVKPFFALSNACELTLDYIIPNFSPYTATVVNRTSCNPRDTGTVVQRLTNANGCDSIITTITTLVPGQATTLLNYTSCNPRDTGTISRTFTSAAGCDSIVTTKTTLLPGRDTSYIYVTSCFPRDTGIVVQRVTNNFGCESFIQTKTTLLPGRDTSFINITSCNPQDTGIVVQRLTNTFGCETFIRTKTTLLPGRDTSFIYITSCNPRDTGIIFQRVTNSFGCESFIQTKTTLLPGRDTTFINITSCNPRDTGIVVQRLTNTFGCETFVRTKTTLLPGRDTTFINITSCNPRDTGIVFQRVINVFGCESFVRTKTTLLFGLDTTYVTAATCNPQDTGILVRRVVNAFGCDGFIQTKTILLRGRDTIFVIIPSCNPRDTGDRKSVV